jgi:hypothetical protein
MKKEDWPNVTEVKLKIKKGSYTEETHDTTTTPRPDGAKPLEWYSFEDLDGNKVTGLTGHITDYKFEG